ncbi:hypothetical protein MSNKSG1_14237 [Marinobacter santoriniensis NKSG1]|uniref:PhnB-like domain-containing protein n=1 Tax=Marinobacter santoriniensis NKSG1 TaxID=1288826 RepID=M7DB54_9GAMM|nr:hypothetical protein MSNKSG1_14237 [Marinobacter santoriniensis NKSG1]
MQHTIHQIYKAESRRVLATLIRLLGDFSLAEEAARFYAGVFPDSSVDGVWRAPGDYPAGKQGDVLTVQFTVLGIPWQITPVAGTDRGH